MSKRQTLRALVNARLASAAEEIFTLFERTIAEYEEELCRSKENQREQQRLDDQTSTLRPPDHTLNQDTTGILHIKEEPGEQSLKQEEEPLPVPLPVSSAFDVMRKEPPLLQQRQIEHRDRTQREDVCSEPHNTEHFSDTDNDEDYEPLLSCSDAQLDTCTAAHTSGLSPKYKSVPLETVTVNNGSVPGTDEGAERKHPCVFCSKRFKTKQHLQVHIRGHTGEKPYRCSVCDKTFVHKGSLVIHRRIHTGEKPFSCPFCNNTYGHKGYLQKHMRTHTGERPYCCPFCGKSFSQKSNLEVHKRTHTGDKPYSCTICNITFTQKTHRDSHMRILHSAE